MKSLGKGVLGIRWPWPATAGVGLTWQFPVMVGRLGLALFAIFGPRGRGAPRHCQVKHATQLQDFPSAFCLHPEFLLATRITAMSHRQLIYDSDLPGRW